MKGNAISEFLKVGDEVTCGLRGGNYMREFVGKVVAIYEDFIIIDKTLANFKWVEYIEKKEKIK